MTPLKPVTCYLQWLGRGKRWLFNDMVSYRMVKGPKINFFFDRYKDGHPKKVRTYDLEFNKEPRALLQEKRVKELSLEGYMFLTPSGVQGKPDKIQIQPEEMKRILKEEGLIKEPEQTKGGWNGID